MDKIRLPQEPGNDLADIPEAAFFTTPPDWGLSETKRKEAIRAYFASVSFMDAQVGQVLDALDQMNLTDKTIVVFWSDHGYNLGEHGQWMKQSLFENAVHVPLIISVPGGSKGKASGRTVELVDLYPTLADLCSLPINLETLRKESQTTVAESGCPMEPGSLLAGGPWENYGPKCPDGTLAIYRMEWGRGGNGVI